MVLRKSAQPQEIEVWYILPAIRKELASEMKKLGIEQKKIASLLSITCAAVSQYANNKRASKIKFKSSIKKEIKKSAKLLKNEKSDVMTQLQRIILLPEMRMFICNIHKSQGGVPKNCKVCFQNA